ncbi:unnamed protein product [Durusdinium trenchii]|uniref:DUF6815 domain-containing protein n=1 Tax=Durusdinium trenchii TaxID=1381693 RepID=A0ABP0QEG0_9DINO
MHKEHTVAEFIEFCVNGRNDKSGTWTSKGVGKYLEGGKEAGGQLVDQRFCPRIVEGELRYNLVGDSLIGVIHKKPKEGGISAVGGTGSIYTFYGPDEPLFKSLTENFLQKDLPHVMPSLDLAEEPLPLWWTTDFINASPPGTKAEDEKWIVGEFNCSCVGISRCLAAYCKDDTPNANWDDISAEDKAEAVLLVVALKESQVPSWRTACVEIAAALKELPADHLAKIKDACMEKKPCPGPVDCSSITVVAKDYKGMLDQPSAPKFKGALAQIYVRSQPYGGSDKSNNGHRYDSIPIVNGMINSGMSCQLIHYTHEEHDKFFELCKNFDFVIVRCNPGQIKADGGDQQKFDDGMRALRKAGKQIWPSPDVMEKMGAKDALCKVATMNIGLEDTLAYYSPEEFAAGFKKTMAFQPRVIKQNRGSSGEGIWIIKLKDENYCKSYGERSCEDGEKLLLMEANDNHEEEWSGFLLEF